MSRQTSFRVMITIQKSPKCFFFSFFVFFSFLRLRCNFPRFNVILPSHIHFSIKLNLFMQVSFVPNHHLDINKIMRFAKSNGFQKIQTTLTEVHSDERGSERRKSDHRSVRTSKVFLRMIRTSKDQNVKNLKRIRTSKVK